MRRKLRTLDLCFKKSKDAGDEATTGSKLFQKLAAATTDTRSPIQCSLRVLTSGTVRISTQIKATVSISAFGGKRRRDSTVRCGDRAFRRWSTLTGQRSAGYHQHVRILTDRLDKSDIYGTRLNSLKDRESWTSVHLERFDLVSPPPPR